MSYSTELLEAKKEGFSSWYIPLLVKKGRTSAKALTAISLFSGGGRLDFGFAAAGFAVGCSSDTDQLSCNTLLLNRWKKPFYNHGNSNKVDIVLGVRKRESEKIGLERSELCQ